jgi:hypothetical protein
MKVISEFSQRNQASKTPVCHECTERPKKAIKQQLDEMKKIGHLKCFRCKNIKAIEEFTTKNQDSVSPLCRGCMTIRKCYGDDDDYGNDIDIGREEYEHRKMFGHFGDSDSNYNDTLDYYQYEDLGADD